MTKLIIGLLGAFVVANQFDAVSNLMAQTNGAPNSISVSAPAPVSVPDANDPVEREYKKLVTDDQAAMDEVDGWIRDNKAFGEKGGSTPAAELNARIRSRWAIVKKSYDDFLKLHPDHARAHLAYGSFLDDTQDEEGSAAEFEKARQLDPTNPAPWNQLANYYGHNGPIKKAFEYYAKAIELDPTEAIYYQNLGTTVYLYRNDAREYYGVDEQAVFNKALGLYQQAMKLDPNNFELAQDVAETYYGIKPTRTQDALVAWTNALNLATNSYEKEGVYIHLARFKLNAERFDEARANLNQVTNALFSELKARVLRNLALQEKEFIKSNLPPAKVEPNTKSQ